LNLKKIRALPAAGFVFAEGVPDGGSGEESDDDAEDGEEESEGDAGDAAPVGTDGPAALSDGGVEDDADDADDGEEEPGEGVIHGFGGFLVGGTAFDKGLEVFVGVEEFGLAFELFEEGHFDAVVEPEAADMAHHRVNQGNKHYDYG